MENTKIAKSSGNVAYLSDVIERGIHPLALRYWFLTSHYKQNSNFTWEALQAANTAFLKLHGKMRDVRSADATAVPRAFASTFLERINDDIDTSGAIALVWETIKDTSLSSAEAKAILLFAEKALGIGLAEPDETLNALLSADDAVEEADIPDDVKKLLEKREKARNQKDFAEADKFRDEITKKGYSIEDSAVGPKLLKV